MQLGHTLQQALDPDSKGNSLFAEVDDGRVARERQLNSVKVKYQSLKKHNAFTREQMNKMQLQISTLLRMWGSQTELEQQERLFTMLEQKNGEIKHLLGEIKNLEKFNTLYESMESKPSTSASPCSLEDSTYYADLLQLKLGKLNKESIKGEQRMKAMFESRAQDIERKLFANERHLQLSERENIKPRAKLDESKLKYEPKPEEKTEAPVLRKRREVLPSDGTPQKRYLLPAPSGKFLDCHFRERRESCLSSLSGSAVQSGPPVSSAIQPASLSPPKEKKCVKFMDGPGSAEALREHSGNTPSSLRLSAECKKLHTIMYASSKSIPEMQCPQQEGVALRGSLKICLCTQYPCGTFAYTSAKTSVTRNSAIP